MLNYTAVEDPPFFPELLEESSVRYWMTERAVPQIDNRRLAHRFSLRLALKCRRIECQPADFSQPADSQQPLDTIFAGESLNVSSKGLIFSGSEVFLPGQGIEVSIEWPVRLDNRIRLALVVEGVVTRHCGTLTAVYFNKYRFTTRSGD
jgi:hypothetical protein